MTKETKYKLELTFTEKDMQQVMDEVGLKKMNGNLLPDLSILDKVNLTMACEFYKNWWKPKKEKEDGSGKQVRSGEGGAQGDPGK